MDRAPCRLTGLDRLWEACGREGRGAGGRHRRRGGRLQHPLPPGQARLARRRPGRAVRPHARLDLAFGRPGRPAALDGQPDQDDAVLGRPLRRPCPRDRQGSRLAPAWRPAPGVVARALRGDPAPGRLGQELWPRDGARVARRGAGDVPANVHRRRGRGRLHPARRLSRSQPAHLRAGRRRPPARGRHRAAHTRHRDHPPQRAGARGGHRQGHDPHRRRRERGRHVRPPDRADGGRAGADHHLWARVPGHRGVRPGARAAADAAGSRPARVLPHRGGRPDHGRLRAQSRAVGARRRAGRVRGAASARGLAPVRAAARKRRRAGAGDGIGRGAQALQRARGVHSRRRVHPGRVRRARLLGGRRFLRPRPGRRGRDGLAGGRVGRPRRAQPRPVAHGQPPLRPPVPQP